LDFPHTASIYLVYELPFYKNQEGLLGHLLGGFETDTTWRYSSGQVWTPALLPGISSSCQGTFDVNFFGISTCRPFMGNPAAPVTVNFSISKTTKISEKVSFRFEAQVYNLLNHLFRGVPDPFVDDCNLASLNVSGCSGSFANNFFNNSGGHLNGASGYTNATL